MACGLCCLLALPAWAAEVSAPAAPALAEPRQQRLLGYSVQAQSAVIETDGVLALLRVTPRQAHAGLLLERVAADRVQLRFTGIDGAALAEASRGADLLLLRQRLREQAARPTTVSVPLPLQPQAAPPAVGQGRGALRAPPQQ